MHIDLNSCFATVEQQANSHLRGKPLVIAAYTGPGGCVISPSIEAKKLGIKVGMRVREARLIYRDVIVRDPDPELVRDVHIRFKTIFKDYSPSVTPKSIDEAVIDFSGMEYVLKRSLPDIAREIKARLRVEIGEWISCSIGIGTNRFLAKVGAGLIKPNGLVLIDHTNVRGVYEKLSLLDLPGINTRFEARLNMAGIFSPLAFLEAPMMKLKGEVFRSIGGYYWYLRLRGWEIDAIDFARKSFGQDYALQKHTNDSYELSRLLMKLCEKMGRRLRQSGYSALGIHVACLYKDGTFWHRGKKIRVEAYTTGELFRRAIWLLNQRNTPEKRIVKLSVSCFDLVKNDTVQETLFDIEGKERKVSRAVDELNSRYGEFVVTPALMAGMDKVIIDRIAFGGVSCLEDIYEMD